MFLTTSNIFFFIQHVPSYWVLMCGRLAGGMATSILFSAFESWVICEHDKVLQINLLNLIPMINSTWAVLLLSNVKCPEIIILPTGLHKFFLENLMITKQLSYINSSCIILDYMVLKLAIGKSEAKHKKPCLLS